MVTSAQPKLLQRKRTHQLAAPEQPLKKQRTKGADMPQDGDSLAGVRVFFIRSTLQAASARLRIWEDKLVKAGGSISKDPSDCAITHAIVGSKTEGMPTGEGSYPGWAKLVRSEWLEASLSQGKRTPEAQYQLNAAALAPPPAAGSGQPPAVRASGKDYRDWLGPRWRPEYANITNDNEIVLMAVYCADNDARVGNGAITKALIELEKYHDALDGDFYSELLYNDDAERPRTHHTVNHRSLSFARVASVVRACAFKIGHGAHNLDADALARKLPFVGAARARQIWDLATTGTTEELEQHRANAQVFSSTGQPYPGAEGSVVRRQFKRLPGVGAATAQRWWSMGLRTFEDVEAASRVGGPLARGGEAPLSTPQAFSLRHRADLLAACTPEDIVEMRDTVLDVLCKVAGEGWTIVTVGGAVRGVASHDADFVVSHPTHSTEGVVEQLYAELCARGRMFPKSEAMCQIQEGRMQQHLEKMLAEVAGTGAAPPPGNLQADRFTPTGTFSLLCQAGRMPHHLESMRDEVERSPKASFFSLHNLAADRFDHIFGNFRTAAGRVRRLDVIIAPADEAAFCVLGWSGSRQWLRFLRQYAMDLGMHLNSHRLMRKEGGRAYLVPDERPPLDRKGRPRWPPGWSAQRRVRSEADIMELLWLEFRPPHERNAP